MLFQKTQMCFNETDYATVHFVINLMTANDVKMTHKKDNNDLKKLLRGTCW